MTFVSSAVNCAQYVLDWSPDGLEGECHQKDYVVLEVEIAAFEYLQKVEGGILHRKKLMNKDIYFTTLVRWRFNLYSFSSLWTVIYDFGGVLCLRHEIKL